MPGYASQVRLCTAILRHIVLVMAALAICAVTAALAKLARQGATPGPELAEQAGVTIEEGHPVAEDLISRGLITRSPERVLALTTTGHQMAEKLFAAERKWLERQLVGWSPEQHAGLEQVLSKLCRALLGDDADRHLLEHEPVSARAASGPLLSGTEAW